MNKTPTKSETTVEERFTDARCKYEMSKEAHDVRMADLKNPQIENIYSGYADFALGFVRSEISLALRRREEEIAKLLNYSDVRLLLKELASRLSSQDK